MSAVYRGDLDIPEKPRRVGWIMVGVGLITVVIAVGIYVQRVQQTSRLADLGSRGSTSAPPTAANVQVDLVQQNRKVVMLTWATILLLGAMFALILVATVSHRLGMRFRDEAGKKTKKTAYSDPWQQAGQRINVPDDLDEQ